MPAHLCELGVVQRHRHHLGDVSFLFIYFYFFYLGEVADARVHRHVGALLQEEKLPASINPMIK